MPERCPRNPIVWQCGKHGKIFTLDFTEVS